MTALSNVALTDAFDVWRTRTNQIIIKLDQLETSDGASFDKANSANVLAFNTGIGANAFTSATIAGANTAVGAGANTYAVAIGTAANSYMISTQNGSNTAVGAGANAFTSATISGANTAVGAGANTVGSAAFNKANSSVIPVRSDTINVTRFIAFINTSSGNASTLNVSTSHLLFNPSSNTVTTNNMYLLTSLGVGTGASGTIGEIRATNDITAYYSSDISLKTNIIPIPNALDKVLSVRGVKFDWTESYIKERGGEDPYFVRKHDVGIIAQEIERILPEIVATRDNGIKAVRYEKLIALLIEAIKELNAKIERK